MIMTLSRRDNPITNKKKYLETPFSLFQTLKPNPQKGRRYTFRRTSCKRGLIVWGSFSD
ncbi:MAG: hypothetical protein ACI3Z9_00065 [Candidatus Onthomorpha sp.]